MQQFEFVATWIAMYMAQCCVDVYVVVFSYYFM